MSTIRELKRVAETDPNVELYLVGGAVRDEMIGRRPKDRDWLVTGLSVRDMKQMGFKEILAGFPVFMTRKGEEVALPRTERKVGKGFKGFETVADPNLSIEDDLRRRDLTINAMAKNALTGEIIDPFGGRRDIQRKIIRAVSPAFAEDPVRVLRAARFAARFGFTVEPQTVKLAKRVAPEIRALPGERVAIDLTKALKQAPDPGEFFSVLDSLGALEITFPEFQTISRSRVGAGITALNHVKDAGGSTSQMLAALLFGLSGDNAERLLRRIAMDRGTIRLTGMVNQTWEDALNFSDLLPIEKVDLLKRMNVRQDFEKLRTVLLVYRAIADALGQGQRFARMMTAAAQAMADVPADVLRQAGQSADPASAVQDIFVNAVQAVTSARIPSILSGLRFLVSEKM